MRIRVILSLVSTILFLYGCKSNSASGISVDEYNAAVAERDAAKAELEKIKADKSNIDNSESGSDISTSDEVIPEHGVAEYVAGNSNAWNMTINLNKDGTFTGVYQKSLELDDDMKEKYSGSVYYSANFNGSFIVGEGSAENSLRLILDKLNIERKSEQEWIDGNTKYLATEEIEGFSENSVYT